MILWGKNFRYLYIGIYKLPFWLVQITFFAMILQMWLLNTHMNKSKKKLFM